MKYKKNPKKIKSKSEMKITKNEKNIENKNK